MLAWLYNFQSYSLCDEITTAIWNNHIKLKHGATFNLQQPNVLTVILCIVFNVKLGKYNDALIKSFLNS